VESNFYHYLDVMNTCHQSHSFGIVGGNNARLDSKSTVKKFWWAYKMNILMVTVLFLRLKYFVTLFCSNDLILQTGM